MMLTTKDKDMLKLKLGLAVFSIVFILIGSELSYLELNLIHPYIWVLICIISYFCVYRTLILIINKNIKAIFNGFEIALLTIFVPIILILSIVRFSYNSDFSSIIIGIGFISLTVFSAMKFVFFDSYKNEVDGLFEDDGVVKLNSMKIEINPAEYEIIIRNSFNKIRLGKENYSYEVWKQLIDNFNKISERKKP